MTKYRLFLIIGLVSAVFALAAAACGDDEDDGDGLEQPTATESMDTAEPTEPAATEPAGETPVAGAEIAPIAMNEVDGSGVTGSASITETDTGGTEVVVTIDGGLEPGTHQSHIHHGVCSDPTGEIHVNLNPVEAGDDGSGSATTTDPQPPDGSEAPDFAHWLAREHYIAVHALTGEVVSCGDVVAAE
jgi:hypothetical protein